MNKLIQKMIAKGKFIFMDVLKPEQIKKNDRNNSKIINLLFKNNWKCNFCSAFVYEIWVYYRKSNRKLLYIPLMINSNGTETRASINHIIPKSKGGKNNTINNQILCENCNQRKGNKIIKEKSRAIQNGQKNKTKRRSKTQLTKGAFNNSINKSIVNLKQNLRVLPKSKRTKENSNFCGVQNDK